MCSMSGISSVSGMQAELDMVRSFVYTSGSGSIYLHKEMCT